jgi:hypothetical protein
VDGVLLKTLHASVALEHGADLLLCMNPLVPMDVAAGEAQGKLEPGALLRRGMPAILSQTFRTMVHSRMVVGMAGYRARYPDADVVLFEPERDEYRLFFSNIFSFSSRREVCQIAYAATRRDLWHRRTTLDATLRRHGLRLRMDVLEDRERDIWEGVGLQRGSASSVVAGRLTRALDRLETVQKPVRRRARQARAPRAV